MMTLYWLPLGAGGHSVKYNGRVYEWLLARIERRTRCDLYHAAVQARVGDSVYTVEMTPVPRSGGDRGVVAQGPVGARWAARLRIFRYEIRCWPGGVIPDLEYAVGGPVRVSDREEAARRFVEVLPHVPTPVWGRDELGTGDMWNSNSVVAWALERSGLDATAIPLPDGGRAPGWHAGVAAARRT